MRHKADFDYLPYFLIGPTLPKRKIGVDVSYEYSTLGCIKKIWEVDPLDCPKCGREMCIISYITEASPPLDEMTVQHIRQVLEMTGGKINGPGGAAQILGLHPNTLRNRMNKLGIPYGRKSWQP